MGRSSISSTNTPFYYRTESNGFFKGPRRVICFCILGVLTPTILMSIPLLTRFVFYGSAIYHLNPSDMRMLDDKISTTWCQGESIKINTTFTAYMTDGVPPLVKTPEPMSIRKTLIVPDDHKEYWGFYLMKGSTYRISTCARFKGGTLLVVKGRQHLEHCAYIGNEDSNGDSDEFSNSNSVEKSNPTDLLQKSYVGPITGRQPPATRRGKKIEPVVLTSSEEMSIILARIRSFVKSRPNGYKKLQKSLVNLMLVDSNSTEVNADKTKIKDTIDKLVTNSTQSVANVLNSLSTTLSNENSNKSSTEPPHKIRHAKSRASHSHTRQSLENAEFGIIRKTRHASDPEVRKMSESGEDGAFEDFSAEIPNENSTDFKHNTTNSSTTNTKNDNSIWVKQHSLHTGIFNTSNDNDGSNSESESSFSSSEEAMAKCEGILGNFFLKPVEECGNFPNDSMIPLIFNATVNVSGYYYFIFGSENEKRDNLIEALFELEKYEYDLGEPFENCTDVKECDVDFQFASYQKLVVSIPQPLPTRGDKWDEYYVGETDCKPRTSLYLIFVLCVPLMILICAFQ